MSSKRVWEVTGQYASGYGGMRKLSSGNPSAYDTLEDALSDIEYLWEAGFGSSMRSYVVPA